MNTSKLRDLLKMAMGVVGPRLGAEPHYLRQILNEALSELDRLEAGARESIWGKGIPQFVGEYWTATGHSDVPHDFRIEIRVRGPEPTPKPSDPAQPVPANTPRDCSTCEFSTPNCLHWRMRPKPETEAPK